MAYDLVVRGGDIIDGSGLSRYRADLGIRGGRIITIGRIKERGRQEIDADGQIVTPGFMDGHTHLDPQFNWDPLGSCSCWHGITSVVMGNCGFTLAPVRRGHHDLLLRNFERAEDISSEAMNAGIRWNWETVKEYLDVVAWQPKAINCAAYVGHSALRTWAMGERAFNEAATAEDLAAMKGQLAEAMRAGAIGFSTSRSLLHRTSDNRPVASTVASWDEVRSLVEVVGDHGAGVFALALGEEMRGLDQEFCAEAFQRYKDLAVETGVPMTFGVVIAAAADDEAWRSQLRLLDSTAAAGGRMVAQTTARGLSIMASFSTVLPFDPLPVWNVIRQRPLEEQKVLLRDPVLRAELVASARNGSYGLDGPCPPPNYSLMRVYGTPLPPHPTVASIAAERGQDPVEVIIDLSLEHDLQLFFQQYYREEPAQDVLEVLRHPRTVMTFTDSGAHVKRTDASAHTQLLAYWARDRKEFTMEEAVRMITLTPARLWGFTDRGLLREGMVADINVIDLERLTTTLPVIAADLPAGAQRIVQRTLGISATIVNGEVVFRDSVHTGVFPGQLLRNTAAQQH